MTRAFAIAVVLASGLPWAEAQEAANPDVLLRVELIEVSHEALTELMADRELVRDGTKLRRRLQELVKTKQAVILETMMTRASKRGPALATSGREWIYPIEIEPPENPAFTRSGSGLLPEVIIRNALLGQVPSTPTAFKTRLAGSTLSLEVEAAQANGMVDFNYLAEFVVKTGERQHQERQRADGNRWGYRTPEFEVISSSNRFVIRDGRYILAETGSRASVPGRRVLVMVRADVGVLESVDGRR